jgi:hypothetical protein
MEDITKKLQKMTKTRKTPRIIIKKGSTKLLSESTSKESSGEYEYSNDS